MVSQPNTSRAREIQESLLDANIGCLLALVLLFGLPFIGLGGFFVYIGHRTMDEQVRLHSKVVSVQAKILSSDIRRSTTRTGTGTGDTTSDYWPQIVFSYEYGGVARTSTMVWPIGQGGNETDAKAVQKRYLEGETVSAFLDPDDPGTAFLEKRWSAMPYLSVILGVFSVAFATGLGILLTGWKRPHLALMVTAATVSLVLVLAVSALGHYLRFMPEESRHWGAILAFGLSLPIALIPLAAILKARQLHRVYLEARSQPQRFDGASPQP